jgi:hypothetical protein
LIIGLHNSYTRLFCDLDVKRGFYWPQQREDHLCNSRNFSLVSSDFTMFGTAENMATLPSSVHY